MRSNYKLIGDYIQPVKLKNADLKVNELLGINIDKFFMPSVANVVGTDLSKYKVVKKDQFACNRMHVGRDYRIPIALSDREEPFMVSPAYDVFEIKDTTILHPEYLMMWFSRKEYDRNAWFFTDADVRGGLAWEAFCNMRFPLPSPEKQREIVAEYNTVKNRIELNNQLIHKLEETAQAIYKQWFVDFEFPDKNGKPYKSSGGKMVFNEELDKEIPEGWKNNNLRNYTNLSQGIQVDIENQFLSKHNGMNRFIRIIDYTPNTAEPPRYVNIKEKKYYCNREDIAMIRYGDAGTVCRRLEGIIANNLFKISPTNGLTNSFLYYYLKTDYAQQQIRSSAASSTMPAITHSAIQDLEILVPGEFEIKNFEMVSQYIENGILHRFDENLKLKAIRELHLSKLTTIES